MMLWVPYITFHVIRPSTTHLTSFDMLQQKYFKEKYSQPCLLKQYQLKENSDRFQLIGLLAEEILAKKGFSDYVKKASYIRYFKTHADIQRNAK